MVLSAKTYGWMLLVRSIKQRLGLLTPGIGSVCRMDVLFRNILSMQGLYTTKKMMGNISAQFQRKGVMLPIF